MVIRNGDIVRVREWDDMASEYGFPRGYCGDRIGTPGLYFTHTMRQYCGMLGVVYGIAGGSFRIKSLDGEEFDGLYSKFMVDLESYNSIVYGTDTKITITLDDLFD